MKLSKDNVYPTLEDLKEHLVEVQLEIKKHAAMQDGALKRERMNDAHKHSNDLVRFIQAERQVIALEAIAQAQANKGAMFEQGIAGILGQYLPAEMTQHPPVGSEPREVGIGIMPLPVPNCHSCGLGFVGRTVYEGALCPRCEEPRANHPEMRPLKETGK